MTAIALRAMADTLGEPAQSVRSLHTTFCAQVPDGEVDIGVEVLRRGRSMSQLRAEVTAPRGRARPPHDGDLRGRATAGSTSPIYDRRPTGTPPDGCRSWRDPVPDGVDFVPMPFWSQLVEGRTI